MVFKVQPFQGLSPGSGSRVQVGISQGSEKFKRQRLKDICKESFSKKHFYVLLENSNNIRIQSSMEFEDLDLNVGKQKQYGKVMLILSVKYDIKYFGINLSKDQAVLSQEDINSIKTDYRRLKNLELWERLLHAITTETWF